MRKLGSIFLILGVGWGSLEDGVEPWIQVSLPAPLPIADVQERESSKDLRLVRAASYTCQGPKGAFSVGGVGSVEDSRAPAWSTVKAPAKLYSQKSEVLVAPSGFQFGAVWCAGDQTDGAS